ncbi:ABC transporter permease [Enterococcus lemanii]|uniref:ABC transporter permease n=1 Tax=Enterococcus lemanii TaxID=1159752 RepID=A0ABV9MTU9_9ENTE|nr:ABC transporter permease [Enterococcus lemanii]MBM7708690.1 putative spermidine/putrescine transport system permease protein [Enterococcus lemanii]
MKKSIPYLILTPGIVLLVFFLMIPLLTNIFPTFFPANGGIQNYLHFFQDDYNRGIFWRTIRISSIVTLVSLILGIPTAYFIAGLNKKWRGILMAMTLFPLLTNSVIRSFAWINILGKNGVINNLLVAIGLIDQPISILYTEFAIIIGSVYLFLPTMIMTLVGVLENIEGEMLEAAETLGASPLIAFIKIVLPLSLPGAIVGSILVFTGTLTAYTTPLLLGGNQKMLLATFLYQKASTLGDWNGVAIIALIMIVTTLLVMQGLNFIAKKIDRREATNA